MVQGEGPFAEKSMSKHMKRQSKPSQCMRCCHGNVAHLNRSRVGVAPGHPALTAAIPWHVAWFLLPNTHLHWACANHTMSKQSQSCLVTLPLTQPVYTHRHLEQGRLHTQNGHNSRDIVLAAVSTVQNPTWFCLICTTLVPVTSRCNPHLKHTCPPDTY